MNIQMTLESKLQNLFPDTEIYWAVIAKNKSGAFTYLDRNGNQIPMNIDDLTKDLGGDNNCNGATLYANYFYSLANVSEISFADDILLESGQVWISLGDWLPFCIPKESVRPNGETDAFAPPSVTNPGLIGYSTPFQILEFTYNKDDSRQLFINTSQVDGLGFPVTLTVKGEDIGSKAVGFTSNRKTLVGAFRNAGDVNFADLIVDADQGDFKGVLRVLAPEHAAIAPDGYTPPPGLGLKDDTINYFTSFYDLYISECWKQYGETPLTIHVDHLAYTGQVVDEVFKWYAGESITGHTVLELVRPHSSEVLGCNGVLAQGNTVQMNIQKFVAAAIFRTVFHLVPTDKQNSWSSPEIVAQYYDHEPINEYGKILHKHSIDELCYAFAYDDVNEQSPSILTEKTQRIEMVLDSWS